MAGTSPVSYPVSSYVHFYLCMQKVDLNSRWQCFIFQFQPCRKFVQTYSKGFRNSFHAEVNLETNDSPCGQHAGQAAVAPAATGPTATHAAASNTVPITSHVTNGIVKPHSGKSEVAWPRAEADRAEQQRGGLRQQHSKEQIFQGCRRLWVIRYPGPVLSVGAEQHQLGSELQVRLIKE